jgi:hypothetical protein
VHRSVILPAVVGVAAGVVTSLIASRLLSRPPDKSAAVEADHERGETAERVATIVGLGKLAQLETRVNAIESDNGRRTDAAVSPAVAPAVAPSEDNEEESRRHHIERHERRISGVRNEPLDARWAERTQPLLRSGLDGLAGKNGFRVKDVVCRNESCLGVVEWKSYAEAVKAYTSILHGLYEANCAREVILPPPSDSSASYEATFVFGCAEWKRDSGR